MNAESRPPFLRIGTITIPVADLGRSVAFYETRLGFRVLVREMMSFAGARIALVAPPDESAVLLLSESDPDRRIGTATGVSLMTGDLGARYREWSALGVEFTEAPQSAPWSARHATFVDPDRNAFQLVEADAVTRRVEVERRAEAARAERERQVAREVAIATQVQASLFPQQRPRLRTLDYDGVCVQARLVGGDYFDFLDCGHGRVGLIVGDVSGKGLGAALLMASLQAHIRAHVASYGADLAGLLSAVNRLFVRSSPSASYASLFFGLYDDVSRRFLFVNCGHPPPLLIGTDGAIQTLDATSWVLGMFEEWNGDAQEIQLAPGDRLVLYTDGVTEAADPEGRELGVTGLGSLLRGLALAPPTELLTQLLAQVQRFGSGAAADDITLVIAQCLP